MSNPQTRTLKLLGPNRLQLTIDGESTVYEIARIPGVALGLSWRRIGKTLEQRDAYHVADTPWDTLECDCWGFVRHGHCKHASATPVVLQLLDGLEAKTGCSIGTLIAALEMRAQAGERETQ